MNARYLRSTFFALALMALVLAIGASGCRLLPWDSGPNLLVTERMGQWRVMGRTPWVLADGVYEGQGSWVAYAEPFEDFVLECDFLFDGKAQGGIVIRGDRKAMHPWKSGYELDIDWAKDRKQGHIHFPIYPEPYAGEALFEPGEWHTVLIEAKYQTVAVFLDGKEVISFTDDRFAKGHICLEGERGGVKYRNLRVLPIRRKRFRRKPRKTEAPPRPPESEG